MALRIIALSTIILLLIFSSACKKLPADCDRFSGWKIISEKSKDEVCNYQQIYMYKDEYYTVCECCECDKAPMAVDCNDEQLCEFTEDCMIDFFAKADYLYSAVED